MSEIKPRIFLILLACVQKNIYIIRMPKCYYKQICDGTSWNVLHCIALFHGLGQPLVKDRGESIGFAVINAYVNFRNVSLHLYGHFWSPGSKTKFDSSLCGGLIHLSVSVTFQEVLGDSVEVMESNMLFNTIVLMCTDLGESGSSMLFTLVYSDLSRYLPTKVTIDSKGAMHLLIFGQWNHLVIPDN